MIEQFSIHARPANVLRYQREASPATALAVPSEKGGFVLGIHVRDGIAGVALRVVRPSGGRAVVHPSVDSKRERVRNRFAQGKNRTSLVVTAARAIFRFIFNCAVTMHKAYPTAGKCQMGGRAVIAETV